jgi:hypothetical protein
MGLEWFQKGEVSALSIAVVVVMVLGSIWGFLRSFRRSTLWPVG